jgi:hypothetical protein
MPLSTTSTKLSGGFDILCIAGSSGLIGNTIALRSWKKIESLTAQDVQDGWFDQVRR